MWFDLFTFIFERIVVELFVFFVVRYVLSNVILTDNCAAFFKSKCQIEYKFYLLHERKKDKEFLELIISITLLTSFFLINNIRLVLLYQYVQSTPLSSLLFVSRVVNVLNTKSNYDIAAVILYGALIYTESMIALFVLLFDVLLKVHFDFEKLHSLHELVVVERDTQAHEIFTWFVIFSTKMGRMLYLIRRYVISVLIFAHIYQMSTFTLKDAFILNWLCYQFSV